MRQSTRVGVPFNWTPIRRLAVGAGRLAGMAGRLDEAVSTLETAAEMSGRHQLSLTGLAGVFGQGGELAEALALHRELTDLASRSYVSPSHLAVSAEAAGQREQAMAFARVVLGTNASRLSSLWARHFPQYRSLHADPRFAAILREMDL